MSDTPVSAWRWISEAVMYVAFFAVCLGGCVAFRYFDEKELALMKRLEVQAQMYSAKEVKP